MAGSSSFLGLISIFAFIVIAESSHRRIPRLVVPEHYRLTLVVNQCDFTGKVAVDVEAKNSTDHFYLHAKNLDIDTENVKLSKIQEDNVELNNIEGEAKQNVEYKFNDNNLPNLNITSSKGDKVKVSLNEPLEVGSKYRLYMEFNGTMNSKKTVGFYCQRYRHGNQTKWLASATLEPAQARTLFPCWDEPGIKANFTVAIAHDKVRKALSNMPLQSSTPYGKENDWVLDTFQTTPRMSTYLLGFLISEYESLSSKSHDGKPIRIWANSERVKYGDLPLRMAARHIKFLEETIGFEDPFPKQDFVAIKNYVAGGLENWGIISYDERQLLFDPRYRRNKQYVLRSCNLVAHELAHMYFGNLITPDWWRDVWMSEGFATYFAAVATNKVYPVWGFDTQAWILAKEGAMLKDCRPTTHPMRLEKDFDSKDVFDEIAYLKGSSILRMLNFTLGEKTFLQGIRSYVQQRKYSTTSHSALFECMEKAAIADGQTFPKDMSLEQLMKPWLYNKGYPVVTVLRNFTTGEVTISQKSILEKENFKSSDPSGWWIPLTYTYQNDNETSTLPRLWLDPRQPNLTIPDPATQDEWLLFNLRGAGYYRTRYDSENAGLLLNDISDLWLEDRVQVVSDMVELARLGFAPVTGSMEAMTWLKDELSPFPWLALLASASKTVTLFKDTELELFYVQFINDILAVGMTRLVDDSPHRKELVTLSCKLGVELCTSMAREQFKKWAEDPKNSIAEDIRYPVYCLGVAEGDAKTWELVNNRLTTATDEKDKKDLLKSLACTKDDILLHKYLDWAVSSNKTAASGKRVTMLKSLARNNVDFLLDSLTIKKSSSKHALHPIKRSSKIQHKWQSVLEEIADTINSPKQLEKLSYLVQGTSDMFKSAVNNNSVLSIAESNIEWLAENKANVANWLNNRQRNKRLSFYA